MVFQIVKAFGLIFISYFLLADLAPLEFLSFFNEILPAQMSGGLLFNDLSGTELIFSISTVGLFGAFFYVRNQVHGRGIDYLISAFSPDTKLNHLIGKKGMVKSIDGDRFISIEGKLYKYETEVKKEKLLGKIYKVIQIKKGVLII